MIYEIKNEGKKFGTEVRSRTVSYLTATLGLVAGLAWNDAVKAVIEVIPYLDKNSVLIKFLYAVIITVVVVALTTYIFKEERK